MTARTMDKVASSLRSTAESAKNASTEHPALFVCGGVAIVASSAYVLYRYFSLNTTSAGRKGSTGLSLGKEKNGDSRWAHFASSWTNGHEHANGGTGKGQLSDVSKAAEVVNDFYSFVTDIYEWGWGASFHFAPKLWGHDWKAGEAAQEVRIAHMLRAKPGNKILDVGCGVGGPMRTIAASTGAHITGITISEYQVERCKLLNERVRLKLRHSLFRMTQLVQRDRGVL
jgi:24-methylenesterol C-methyltransferase